MMNYIIFLAGLNELSQSVITDWIGPIYLLGVAGFALYFIKDREFRKLAAFLGIAAIVGALIFFGKDWFGNGGKLTKAAKSIGDKVGETGGGGADANMILPIVSQKQ